MVMLEVIVCFLTSLTGRGALEGDDGADVDAFTLEIP
jgi:hypothetical protein